MKLCFDIVWAKSSTKNGPDGSVFYINEFFPDADWVIDVSSRPFSELSSKYPQTKRIFVAGEPSLYMNFTAERIRLFDKFYKGAIFSWYKELMHLPQARPFRLGMTRVGNACKEQKTFGIGGIFSKKSDPKFTGYRIRRELIGFQGQITIPNMIYHPGRSWNGISFTYPYPNKKDSLDFMFHLAIENCAEEGYFTEKIIDCFYSSSIPIYYGDPKIGEIFDGGGIIRLDESDMLTQINSLTENMYHSKIQSVIENKKRAVLYGNLEVNIYNHIKKYLGAKNDTLD